jgi:N-acetylglucosaminyl-diphospho-decaprenol L-rhamnosyltransferase
MKEKSMPLPGKNCLSFNGTTVLNTADAPTSGIDVSIIIVNWNAKDILFQNLSYLTQLPHHPIIQIIVVDNASKDGSIQMIRGCFPQVALLSSDANLGFSKACNLGLRVAIAPFIMFLNPDAILTANTLPLALDFLSRNPQIGALGCKIIDSTGRPYSLGIQCYPSPWSEALRMMLYTKHTAHLFPTIFPMQDPNSSGYVLKLSGACLIARRSVLKALGGFDDRFFMYADDVDLCRRIAGAGWRLYYLSSATVIHHQGSCSRKAPRNFPILMFYKSTSQFIFKYHGAFGRAVFIILAFFLALFRLSIGIIALTFCCLAFHRHVQACVAAIRKHLSIISWSIGLSSPTIP